MADAQQKKINAKIVEDLKNSKWVYLQGNTGTGKSRLACYVLYDSIKKFVEEREAELYKEFDPYNPRNPYARPRKISVLFKNTVDMFNELRDTFNRKEQGSLQENIELLCGCDLLVLDDIGTENPTPWAVEQLYLVINQRYANNALTIVTSNFSLKELNR